MHARISRTLGAFGVAAALVGGGVAAPATAGTGCASGYMCYFDDWNNSTMRENHDTGANYSFAGESWLYISGGSQTIIPGTNLDNGIDAHNNQWNTDVGTFYTTAGYGGSLIHQLDPEEQGFDNWAITDVNIASSLKCFGAC